MATNVNSEVALHLPEILKQVQDDDRRVLCCRYSFPASGLGS